MKYLLIVIVVFFTAYSSKGQADELTLSAIKAYDSGDYESAYNLYIQCVATDSTEVSFLEKAGLSAYRVGMVAESKTSFLKALELDTLNQIAMSQLASIYEQESNTPKAIKFYTKLSESFPDNAIYKRKLAQNYANGGLTVEAFSYFAQAYKLNPKDLFSIKGLTEIFQKNEQYNEADSLMHFGLSLDSTNINLHQLIARSKYKQKEYDSTIYYLKKITGQVDLSPYFNKLLGYSLIQIDSFEQSIFYLERALMDDGSKEYAHYYLATAYENMDNIPYAEHHYKKALEEGISPNISNYHRSLAKIYNESSKLKEAIPHYQDAFKYSDDPVILFYLARAADTYYKDKSIAISYYKKYIKSKHNNEEYKTYAKSRARILKEAQHQAK
jgi:tetratricopeptide (TPR) repeat protein